MLYPQEKIRVMSVSHTRRSPTTRLLSKCPVRLFLSNGEASIKVKGNQYRLKGNVRGIAFGMLDHSMALIVQFFSSFLSCRSQIATQIIDFGDDLAPSRCCPERSQWSTSVVKQRQSSIDDRAWEGSRKNNIEFSNFLAIDCYWNHNPPSHLGSTGRSRAQL